MDGREAFSDFKAVKIPDHCRFFPFERNGSEVVLEGFSGTGALLKLYATVKEESWNTEEESLGFKDDRMTHNVVVSVDRIEKAFFKPKAVFVPTQDFDVIENDIPF